MSRRRALRQLFERRCPNGRARARAKLLDPPQAKTAQPGTMAREREDGLDVRVQLPALPSGVAILWPVRVPDVECFEVRPCLCACADVHGGVQHDRATKLHREAAQGVVREQRGKKLPKRRVRPPVAQVSSPPAPGLIAGPLQRRETRAFRDQHAEVVREVMG